MIRLNDIVISDLSVLYGSITKLASNYPTPIYDTAESKKLAKDISDDATILLDQMFGIFLTEFAFTPTKDEILEVWKSPPSFDNFEKDCQELVYSTIPLAIFKDLAGKRKISFKAGDMKNWKNFVLRYSPLLPKK